MSIFFYLLAIRVVQFVGFNRSEQAKNNCSKKVEQYEIQLQNKTPTVPQAAADANFAPEHIHGILECTNLTNLTVAASVISS